MGSKGRKAGTGAKKTANEPGVLIVARNRAAQRRWTVEETLEAGLVLTGTEVKAVREGKAQLGDSYATARAGEIFLMNLHIGPYHAAGPYAQHEPERPRKLLLKRGQIERLEGHLTRKGYSLIPLDVHFRDGWAKVKLALCHGKRVPDRREDIKKREADLEMERALKRG